MTRRGRPALRPEDRTPEELSVLASDATDTAAAVQLGLSRQRVAQLRARLGVSRSTRGASRPRTRVEVYVEDRELIVQRARDAGLQVPAYVERLLRSSA